jgi:Holliday junction DNA helicase RuvA
VIRRIVGVVERVEPEVVELAVGPYVHEVLVPEIVRRSLQQRLSQEVALHTLEYLEGNPARGNLVPRLVGFLSVVEREFFELFCEVEKVGVRRALRAIVRPVAEIAAAIDDQDTKLLSTLPGIGPATAEQMVAKLRRKMPKFALLVARETPGDAAGMDVYGETYDVLRSLGHSESDARRLIDALRTETKRKVRDVQEALEVIYRQVQQPRGH